MSYRTVDDGTPEGTIIMNGSNTKKSNVTRSEKKNETAIKVSQGKLPSRKLDSNDLGDVVKAATKTASQDDVEKLQYLMRLLSEEEKPCTQKDLAAQLKVKLPDLNRFIRREKGATLPQDVKNRANTLLVRLEKKKAETEKVATVAAASSSNKGKGMVSKK